MPVFKMLLVQMIPYQTLIKIDPNNKKPVYEQIATVFFNLINNGNLQPGTKLPSSRTLAEMLKFHRKTIVCAYEELINQGWIISKNKSGYYVNSDISIARFTNENGNESRFPTKLPIPVKVHVPQIVDHKERLNDIFLDDGLPDPRIAPYKALLREFRTLSDRDYNLKKANYGTSIKSSSLAVALISHLANSRGISPSISNVFITNGAQMGIYLVGKALINPGDVYVVGSPGYGIADQAFIENGARIIHVQVDKNGIDIDALANICKRENVKGVYVIPHHHYPSTVTLSPDRRIKLISLAEEYNFVIIEDDYDYDFHYSSAPHLPIASYNHNGRVIYIGSISKCFSPSLRLGFVVGSNDLIDAVKHFRKMIDIRGDTLMEQATAALFENGEIERHLRKSNKLYKERRDYMCGQIDLHLKDFVSYQAPAGGMAIWIQFFKEYNVNQVLLLLKSYGISFSQNIVFKQNEDMNHIRLGFASLNFQEISRCINAISKSCIILCNK